MKFLADVNIPLPLIKLLIKKGHEVSDARIRYSSAKDIQLIAVRLTNQKTTNIVSHMEELLNNYSEEILLQSITVIYEDIAESFPLK